MTQGMVSVIIPSKNSSETMRTCLESVRKQTYTNLEVIVVDNFSTDNTVAIAEEYADQVISSGPERSPQGNIGAKAANGEFLYFVGSDFLLDQTIIEEAVALVRDKNVDAVITPNLSDATVSRWARARAFERSMYIGDDLNVSARFLRRELFFDLGGFDESLIAAEDYDFQLRLVAHGAKFAHTRASELHLGEPKTLKEVVKKHYFYGGDLRKYVRKHGNQTVQQLSPLRPAFFRNYKQFLRQPAEALNFFVYQTAKYASGGAGWIFGGRSAEAKAKVPKSVATGAS